MRLAVNEFGSFVYNRGERVLVKTGRETAEYSLRRIDEIILEARGTSVSTELLREAASRGIPVMITHQDSPAAFVESVLPGKRAETIISQVNARENGKAQKAPARMVAGKINGQWRVIRSLKKTGLTERSLTSKRENAFQTRSPPATRWRRKRNSRPNTGESWRLSAGQAGAPGAAQPTRSTRA
jgi:CRISPR/Cas system-associated endonuclease Cas1